MSNLVCVPLKDAKLPYVDHFIWMLQQTQIWLCEEHSNFLIKSTTEIQAQKILFIEYGMEPRNLFLTKFYRIKNLSNSDILFLLENKAIKSFLHKQNTSSGRKGSWRVGRGAAKCQCRLLGMTWVLHTPTHSSCATTLPKIKPLKIWTRVTKGSWDPIPRGGAIGNCWLLGKGESLLL